LKQEQLSQQSLKTAEALYGELLSQQGQSIPKGALHATSQRILDILQDVRSGSTAEAKANNLRKAVLKLLK
jgi:response regulator of citrate/malate metabolism